MKTRRSFLAALAGLVPAVLFGRRAAANDPVVRPCADGLRIGDALQREWKLIKTEQRGDCLVFTYRIPRSDAGE